MLYKGVNFEDIGDRLSIDIIKAIDWGANLPDAYMKFLLNVNGGTPDKNMFKFNDIDGKSTNDIVISFYGITSKYQNIIPTLQFRGNIIPNRMLAVACALEGNLVVMSLKNPDRGKIYLWDARYESEIINLENIGNDLLSHLANSFDEFLGMLHEPEPLPEGI